MFASQAFSKSHGKFMKVFWDQGLGRWQGAWHQTVGSVTAAGKKKDGVPPRWRGSCAMFGCFVFNPFFNTCLCPSWDIGLLGGLVVPKTNLQKNQLSSQIAPMFASMVPYQQRTDMRNTCSSCYLWMWWLRKFDVLTISAGVSTFCFNESYNTLNKA